jgi:hypothetical protein
MLSIFLIKLGVSPIGGVLSFFFVPFLLNPLLKPHCPLQPLKKVKQAQ